MTTRTDRPSFAAALAKRLFFCELSELPLALLLCLLQFSILFSYGLIKPAQSALLLHRLGARWLPFAYLIGPLATILSVVVYQWVAAKLRRDLLVTVVVLFFAANLIFFWRIMRGSNPYWAAVLFIWSDVFSVTVVSMGWSYANDLLGPSQGKRLIGPIATGATLGGILSSWFTQAHAQTFGTENLLFISALALLPCILVAMLVRHYDLGLAADEQTAPAPAEQRGATTTSTLARLRERARPLIEGLILIVRSSYLTQILLLLGTMLLASLLVEVEFSTLLEQTVSQQDVKTAYLGDMLFWVNVTNFVVQLFLVGRIVRLFGMRTALLIHPASTVVTLGVGAARPVLPVLRWVKLIDWTLKYGVAKATGEMLWLPTSRAAKYRAKAFVDIFFYRFAKGLVAVLVLVGMRWLNFGVREFLCLALALTAAWLVTAARVGAGYQSEVTRRITAIVGEVPAAAIAETATREELQQALARCYLAYSSAASDNSHTAVQVVPEEVQQLFALLARSLGKRELAALPPLLAKPKAQEGALALEYLDSVLLPELRPLVLPLATPGLTPETARSLALATTGI